MRNTVYRPHYTTRYKYPKDANNDLLQDTGQHVAKFLLFIEGKKVCSSMHIVEKCMVFWDTKEFLVGHSWISLFASKLSPLQTILNKTRVLYGCVESLSTYSLRDLFSYHSCKPFPYDYFRNK